MFENLPGIIPSLDVEIGEARRVVEEIKDLRREICGLKIGSLLAWKYGLQRVVEEMKKTSDFKFPIIFDAQKAGTDIPEMTRKQVKVVADAGVDAFIAAPQGAGSATLAAFVDACLEHEIIPIVVVEMTHQDFDAFLSGDASEKILEDALERGVEDFVAPANKPERLKFYKNFAEEKKKGIKIFSPGVGPQGGGPDSAVAAGADFVIVGRAIYEAENPRREVIQIYEKIKKVKKAV